MPFNEGGEWEKKKKPILLDLFKGMSDAPPPSFFLDFPEQLKTPPSKIDYTPLAKQANKTVDIVIPIYRAATQLKACVESIFKHTNRQFHLYLVDDASEDSGVDELLNSVKDDPRVTVLKQDINRGFASTVNIGCVNGTGDWLCILNSDTLVTPNWLSKCIAAGEADPRNVIVNPITNNTALINVPMIEGCSYHDMNRLMELVSTQEYPEIMPTGFCFIVRRNIFTRLGFFDEGFKSYGEETDFWMRSLQWLDYGIHKGLRAVLADDTYIFHERGTSFGALGHEAHMDLRKGGSKRFHARNPGYKAWANTLKMDWLTKYRTQNEPVQKGTPNVLWLVTSTAPCGGMNLVTDYINAMIEKGWNAKVVEVKRDPTDRTPSEVVSNLRTQPIVLYSLGDVPKIPFQEGVIVASTVELLSAAYAIQMHNPEFKIIHHIQSNDFELTTDEETKEDLEALVKEKHVTRIGASASAAKAIQDKAGEKESIPIVLPGVDTLLFRPRKRTGDTRPTVLIHANSLYPFKGYDRAVQLAAELTRQSKGTLRILATGVVNMPEVPSVIALGAVPNNRMAKLLSEVDAVIDPSYSHSYGMPQAEALASGLPFFCWDNKGCWEFGPAAVNPAYVVLKENEKEYGLIANNILQVVKTRTESGTLIPSSSLPPGHDREKNVNLFLKEFKKALGHCSPDPKTIVIVTPHVRKHGGPTTIVDLANQLKKRGHEVLLTSVYSDYNPEVVKQSNVPINYAWNNPIKTDLLICNGDSDKFEFFKDYPATKKIMLKLSHNPRFMALEEQGLSIPWDHIMTSSEWLKDICFKNKIKQWGEEDVTRVGWRHYAHNLFNQFNNRQFGSMASNNLTIGTLFHAHPTKGSDQALNVLRKISDAYDFKISLVGEVEGMKAKGNMKYFYKPSREQMAEIMSQCDIWLNASHSEGLGRMALEAASAGAALVCTDTGSEFLTHEENCLLVPVKDEEEMYKAVERVMQDDGLRGKLRLNAYDTACSYADPTTYIDSVEDVISKVFNE